MQHRTLTFIAYYCNKSSKDFVLSLFKYVVLHTIRSAYGTDGKYANNNLQHRRTLALTSTCMYKKFRYFSQAYCVMVIIVRYFRFILP
jgi:hypothetical protein